MAFWPLTNSDFPTDQTFHQFHDLYTCTELDLHRIMSGFHGAFATGVASQQGTLTLPDTWFRPLFWDLLMLQLLRPNSSNLPCLYSTFHLEYPLVLSRFCFVTFLTGLSILHSLDWLIFPVKEFTYADHGIQLAPNKDIAYTGYQTSKNIRKILQVILWPVV